MVIMRVRLAALVFFGLLTSSALCSAGDALPAITIDGAFGDWKSGDDFTVVDDPVGDRPPPALGWDLSRLTITNDEAHLYLRLETGFEIDLGEGNPITLLIDTDDSVATGEVTSGIGADLIFHFGQRSGRVVVLGENMNVRHADIGLRVGPTVSGKSFEIAIPRDVEPLMGQPLLREETIRLKLRVEGGFDELPDEGAIEYSFLEGSAPPVKPIPLERVLARDVRTVTYNVRFDSPFAPGQGARFGRQLAAIQPDIINFQEIFDSSPAAVLSFVERWLPSGAWKEWHVAKHEDNVTVSRFPILGQWATTGNLVALLDTTKAFGRPTLLFNCHFPCCGQESKRDFEIASLLEFLRAARTAGEGELDIEPGTPVIITGDLNLVGRAKQLETLRNGKLNSLELVDEALRDSAGFGEDFAPDWDGSALRSVLPRQTERRMGYTWRNDSGAFWPGQLDFVIYSDSAIEQGRSFVLYTPNMSAETRKTHGLQAGDSWASDHLPFVVDFRLPLRIAADLDGGGEVGPADLGLLLGNWGGDDTGDLNGDGIVDADDAELLLSVWGEKTF